MKEKTRSTQIVRKVAMLLLALIFVFSNSAIFSRQVIAAAAPPRFISYQGRILNANSVPVSDATIDMIFEFYDSLAGGSCLWSNSAADCSTATAKTVTLTDGLFTQNLGDTGDSFAAIPTTIFDDASVYLQVTIDGETLTPRKRLLASPYAMNSDMLDGLDSTAFFGLVSNNTISGVNDFTSSTLSGASPLVFEGATADDYETIFSFTDPTLSDKTITFQNASGTVAFLNDIGWTDGGATVYATTATDNIAVGGTVVSASTFGVDPSSAIIYFGDTATNPVLRFQDATAGTGSLTYNADNWEFSGGDIIYYSDIAYAAAPGDTYGFIGSATLSASAGGGAGTYQPYLSFYQLTNASVESGGYDQIPTGSGGKAINTGTGEVFGLRGLEGSAVNSSTSASAIESSMLGVYGGASNSGAGSTVPFSAGAYGISYASAGTITDAVGVYGTIGLSAGTLTRALAGDFSSTVAGTNRYGVRATASGGGTNYAGYFFGSAVHIDNSSTPSSATYATGAGDLYVYDQLEIHGTNQTNGYIASISSSTLTGGSALNIVRESSATDLTGALARLEIADAGSTGNVLLLQQGGVGSSLYINQLGDDQALKVVALSTTDYIARFFNDGNLDTNMGIDIQACIDTNPTTACNYLTFKDGNGTVLGAVEGNGAGGVTNASAGSDYAELFFGQLSDFAEGDIVGLDSSGNAILASDADKIIGAYSVAPNTLGNWFDDWQSSGSYVPVALLGQVPVNVNDQGGSITAGDYLTLSSVPGVAKKATGVGYVVGRALESHTSGTGVIQVYVSPKWQAINVLTQDGSMTSVGTDFVLGATGTADAVTTGLDSYGLMLRGSGWDGATAQDISISMLADITDASNYKLSFRNTDDAEVAFINQDGDMALSGRLYPSDRGTLQTDKYIYYDGSTGLGGDFMRTNASGWGSGSYDFAEMFPVTEAVSAGEVVVFSDKKDSVKRSSGTTYDSRIAGIVSTQPGFLAGNNVDGHVPIALAGRVPTYVSNENGSISIGDPLTTSSKPGYAMKATQAGPIVGYAMQAFSGSTGSISVFVRPSYYDGSGSPDISDNVVTQVASSSTLDLSGAISLNGGSILSAGSISGIGNIWSISEDGTFKTTGRFVESISSYGGEKIEAYAVASTQTMIELSGTIKLQQGSAHVIFNEVDENFAKIISNTAPYRVFLTADSPTGSLYAMNRDHEGFFIGDTEGSTGAYVDWLVIAYHKDYEPEEEPLLKDNIAEEKEVEEVEEVIEEEVEQDEEVISEEIIEDQEVVEEEVVDEVIVDEVDEVIVEEEGIEEVEGIEVIVDDEVVKDEEIVESEPIIENSVVPVE